MLAVADAAVALLELGSCVDVHRTSLNVVAMDCSDAYVAVGCGGWADISLISEVDDAGSEIWISLFWESGRFLRFLSDPQIA